MLLVPAIGWLWLAGLILLGLVGFPVRRHHFEAAAICFAVGCTVFAALHWRDVRLRRVALSLRETWTISLVPSAVAMVAFAWSRGLGPLSDDFVLAKWATTGDWTATGWSYFRPLPLMLWSSVLGWGGWATLHLVNVGLHAINSALAANLVSGWAGARAGIVAGVVFAMFPASTEAVAWTAGVFDLMSTFSVLLAAIIWTRFPPTARSTVALVVCCAAGLLSKEIAVVIPALLGLITILTPYDTRVELRRRSLALGVLVMTVCGVLAARLLSSNTVVNHLANLPEIAGSGRTCLSDRLRHWLSRSELKTVSVPIATCSA